MPLTKEQRERLVFEHFAKAMGLIPGGSFESRIPQEPDILYAPEGGPRLAYELVEIIDRDFSSSLGRQLCTKDICASYLDSLPSPQSEAFRRRYADADIFLGFRGAMTLQRRRNSLPKIFEQLMGFSPGFTGEAFAEGTLESLIDRIAVHRGRFVGPLFDAPSVTWVGDPTVDALAGKINKTYKPQGRLCLLAYIDGNPMFPDEVWLGNLAEYLSSLGPDCQFERIDVYECRSSSVRRSWRRDA